MPYLYRHIRIDKNEPFYIGLGMESYINNTHKRLYKRAYNKHERNGIWNSIVAKTEYEIEIIFESVTKAVKSISISLRAMCAYLLNPEKAKIKRPFEYYN